VRKGRRTVETLEGTATLTGWTQGPHVGAVSKQTQDARRSAVCTSSRRAVLAVEYVQRPAAPAVTTRPWKRPHQPVGAAGKGLQPTRSADTGAYDGDAYGAGGEGEPRRREVEGFLQQSWTRLSRPGTCAGRTFQGGDRVLTGPSRALGAGLGEGPSVSADARAGGKQSFWPPRDPLQAGAWNAGGRAAKSGSARQSRAACSRNEPTRPRAGRATGQ